jgi:hypothetical protein
MSTSSAGDGSDGEEGGSVPLALATAHACVGNFAVAPTTVRYAARKAALTLSRHAASAAPAAGGGGRDRGGGGGGGGGNGAVKLGIVGSEGSAVRWFKKRELDLPLADAGIVPGTVLAYKRPSNCAVM